MTVAELCFWDGWQEVQETDSSGVAQRTYVYGEGIDEVLRATIPVNIFYHENSIGSIAAVTNGAGVVLESYRYEAFGRVSIFDQSGAPVSTTQVKQPFMFTRRRLDWEEGSGLYFYRCRYYDPAVGRFISRDPLGVWGDAGQRGNGQSYAGNNPVNRIDPLGLDDARPTKILIRYDSRESRYFAEDVERNLRATLMRNLNMDVEFAVLPDEFRTGADIVNGVRRDPNNYAVVVLQVFMHVDHDEHFSAGGPVGGLMCRPM